MGLDMYAFAVSKDLVGDSQVDVKVIAGKQELAYWRKFNHLHGWMEKLYRTKGGMEEEFNCTTVRLNEDDLDSLEQALRNGELEAMYGFFFGSDEIDQSDVNTTVQFIKDARQAIKDDMAVFYDNWW